jgi:hypothetical protein
MSSLLRLLFLVSVLCGTSQVVADDNDGEVITELGWGEALFFHFRGDKLEALTRLSARMKQGALGNHQARAELLTAGLLLDYGLPHVAAETLNRIDMSRFDPVINAKLSLANARVFYQQQDFIAAEASLAEVKTDYLDDQEVAQAGFMQAQIEFDTGRYEASAQTLARVTDTSNLKLYVQYNQGISLLQLAEPAKQQLAIQLLQQVANTEILDQEQYALADQAKLALAMTAISEAQFEQAQSLLSSIRLDGLVSNEALLLLGWSYAGQAQYQRALDYWQQVASHEDILSPVVQEAWLATPYAWQQQGNKSAALAGYQRALSIQTVALARLADLKSEPLWRELLPIKNQIQPFKQSPAIYRELVADPEFHELKAQWQELSDLLNHLEQQTRLIPILSMAVEENRNRYQTKASQATGILGDVDINALKAQAQQFENALTEQKSQDVAIALMDPEQQQIWQRIKRSEQTIAELSGTDDYADKAEQLNRVRGVAQWQFHRQRKQLEWRAERSQQQLNQALEQLSLQHQALANLTEVNEAPIEVDAGILAQMANQNSQLISEVRQIQLRLENAMNQVYESFLEQRVMALNDLGEQANLAIARLNFELVTGGNSDE